MHLEIMRDAAYKAFSEPMRISGPKKIHFISESNAVAFHYIQERMNKIPEAGIEQILVYDFGGGTLDLSLVCVHWNDAGGFDKWKVERVLGVPLAGNHIDALLAREVHEALSDPDILKGEFNYQYPFVMGSGSADQDKNEIDINFQREVAKLWLEIREVKKRWKRDQPFIVVVGETGNTAGMVTLNTDKNPEDFGAVKGDDEKELYCEKGKIKLRIPADHLTKDGARLINFIKFVTEEVIDELLSQNSMALDSQVRRTVLISGRGAKV